MGTRRGRNHPSTTPFSSSTMAVPMSSSFWAELLRALFDPSPPFTPEMNNRRWGSTAQPNLRLPRTDWTDAAGLNSNRLTPGSSKNYDDSPLPDGWGKWFNLSSYIYSVGSYAGLFVWSAMILMNMGVYLYAIHFFSFYIYIRITHINAILISSGSMHNAAK